MSIETPIAFDSEGATLRGYVLTEAGVHPRPTVIMAHGTSATIKMVAIEYARAFAKAGFAVLIYDHRNFGASGGQPRQEINPWVQCRGYVDALTFACTRPEVDPERVGLWGDSYTGGQVVLVSACDARPKAMVHRLWWPPRFRLGQSCGPSRPTNPGALQSIPVCALCPSQGSVHGFA